jgi:hypothetical protein
MNLSVEFYRSHSPSTDPREFAHLLDGLPTDLPGLHQIVQNIIVHNWKISAYNPHLLHPNHLLFHTMRDLLAEVVKLDDRPLTEERPLEKKLILDCRHFASILVSFLRHQNVPARVRCGFGVYLEEVKVQDHYVCEYSNGERWVLEDADVIMHDIARDQFVVAGQAWRDSRAGTDDPNRFYCGPDWRGYSPIKMNVLKDLAGLNKDEEMSLGSWGLIDKEIEDLTPDDYALLDHVADFEARAYQLSEEEFGLMRTLYRENNRLHVPVNLRHFNYIADQWSERPAVLNEAVQASS